MVPLVLIVSPELPVKSVKELIAYGKANPGKLTFASSGNGGAPHFSGELFKSMTGLDITHIPYKGSTLAHPDLAPAGTPKATVAKLSTEVNRILALPDVRKTMLANGIEPGSGTPQQFADLIAAEMVKWAKVAKDAGVQPE